MTPLTAEHWLVILVGLDVVLSLISVGLALVERKKPAPRKRKKPILGSGKFGPLEWKVAEKMPGVAHDLAQAILDGTPIEWQNVEEIPKPKTADLEAVKRLIKEAKEGRCPSTPVIRIGDVDPNYAAEHLALDGEGHPHVLDSAVAPKPKPRRPKKPKKEDDNV
jgi:hypothetical protein